MHLMGEREEGRERENVKELSQRREREGEGERERKRVNMVGFI